METGDYACENGPTPCVSGVGQVLVLAAETARRGRRSGALTRLEQSPVLEEGVAIGHAGDVISDRASARGGSVCGFRAQRLVPVLRRHETHVLEKCLEQLLHHAPRLRSQDRKSTRLNSVTL